MDRIIKIPTKWQFRRTRLILSEDNTTLSFPGLVNPQTNKINGKQVVIRRITSCPQMVSNYVYPRSVSRSSYSPSSATEQSAFSLDRCLPHQVEFPKFGEQSSKWYGAKLYQSNNPNNPNNPKLNGMNGMSDMNDMCGLEIEPLFRIHMKIKNQRNGVLISRDFWA